MLNCLARGLRRRANARPLVLQRGVRRSAAAMATQQHMAAAAAAAAGAAADAPDSGLLVAKEDMYGGVIIDPEALPADADVFAHALERSVQAWAAQGKRGLWLKVPLSKAHLVGPAAAPGRGGFQFHHAEADYVMMTRWLPAAPSTLPPNASHQVGVGAFVLNEAGEVLVVQEASGPLKGKQVWKMPTGLVHQGEDLVLAAEREVLEEAGVRAAVEAVICIRQAHGFQFGKSDLFFCMAMRTTEPGQIPMPLQEVEVEAARWMPLAEYAGRHFQLGVPLYETMLDRCVAWAEGRYSGWKIAGLEAGMWGRTRVDTLAWGAAGDAAAGGRPTGAGAAGGNGRGAAAASTL
ncbi:MAG: NUDIX hydrolase domain-like protein [Monoraphidium minutum]|nr:MAG: NUDIX hydrolase domain-like protein [Monoraphidium minutum]